MSAVVFLCVLLFVGWLLFDEGDWGHRKHTGKKINGVDVGAYRRFHDRHLGPGSKYPPVPK